MAIRTNIDSEEAQESEVKYYDSTPDFNTNDSVENDNVVFDYDAAQRKKQIKSDIFTTIATGLINGAPMIIDALKHRKDATPYKIQKSELVKFGVSMVMPTLQLVDTVALKGKIRTTLEEKTPITLNDIRNVVNVVQAYPSTHKALTNFMSNVQAQSAGKQQIEIQPTIKRDAILSCINTISPYVVDKFCDNSMTFVEKCSAVIPIKLFGGLVRKFVSTNPKLQQGYEVLTSTVRVLDYGNKTLGSAVRSNSNMRTGAVNTLGNVLDIVQDATGMARGNISRYGDQYDGWNGGNRFNNY